MENNRDVKNHKKNIDQQRKYVIMSVSGWSKHGLCKASSIKEIEYAAGSRRRRGTELSKEGKGVYNYEESIHFFGKWT